MNETPTKAAVETHGIGKTLGLCGVAMVPLVLLAWGVAPFAAARFPLWAPLLYWLLMTAGMAWIGFIAVRTIRHEEGHLRWRTFARRVWFNLPQSPKTRQPNGRLFWWMLPCLLIAFIGLILQLLLMMTINTVVAFNLPWCWWPRLWPGYANLLELVNPQFADHWLVVAVVMVSWLVSNL
ncbi:MAG TPA: hypothetical protein VF988_00665, partial [Verrucomicrobiae bacterium]